MRDSEVVECLRQIDTLQGKITDIIYEIEASDHPRAAELVDDLWEQCWFAASAEHVGVDYLNKGRWSLEVLPSGSLGGIISRQLARKKGTKTVD